MACPVVSPQQALRMPQQIAVLRELARSFPDSRTGKNRIYLMEDALLGAFSVFYTQCASFLAHQTAMTEVQGKSNAHTLFGMRDIPSDNHIRNLLDPVDPQYVFPAFERIFNALKDTGQLDTFRMANGQMLIALDGTSYHQSHAIHCPQCTVTEHKKGGTSFTHTVVTPVVVSTAHNRVIPLEPEFVTPQDGHAKQDCESA
ncbi:ISNCY family transposase, partial [Acidithiobacillus sp. MC6.1]|nr:ISNCY family transposase [Acidithiobacillus sp. MC6.1]